MTRTIRPEPKIPDHEVLRKIGGGAFGEIWMARGVTGAWRAVKVVWRDDYEDDREFDREFEGLLKYEPISRTSDGLVDVLHVGRAEDNSFYYYVMELADDCYDGQNFNPVEYQPRTIHSDLADANGKPIPIDRTLGIAISLTKGLKALHDKGLAHRDIKPANVIFVNGKAKLADIGLVATRGQRTFVGTEGFVPPEGPGTAQADLYGLGKVLYEISTGKDRLQFPEAAEELPDDKKELKACRELSKVIFDVCDNSVSRRRLKTALLLLRELEGLAKGRAATNVGFVASLKTMILGSVSSSVIILGTWFMGFELNWWPFGPDQALELMMNNNDSFSYAPPVRMSNFRVQSVPEGAEVYLLSSSYGGEEGETTSQYIGVTPLEKSAAGGSVVNLRLELPGYRRVETKGIVPTNQPLVLFEQLDSFTPPEKDKPWQDSRGRKYVPDGDFHTSINHVTSHDWNLFSQWTGLGDQFSTQEVSISENGVTESVVYVTSRGMAVYCDWLTKESRNGGYLSRDQVIEPIANKTIDAATINEGRHEIVLRPFRCKVFPIMPAKVLIESQPPGAKVTLSGQIQEGVTPLSLQNIEPMTYQVLITKEGYKPVSAMHRFRNGKEYNLKLHLEKASEVEFGKPWENSINMKFVPVGDRLLVSKWETRVRDYLLAVNSGGVPKLKAARFHQNQNHPVVGVSRKDAKAFCQWLTAKERILEKISDTQEYRLPTDAEWSLMVGLEELPRPYPVQREQSLKRSFPWGDKWPPMNEEAAWSNLADATSVRALKVDASKAIPEYDDQHANTSPVGSFPANQYGIYDLGGNVREWVSDSYNEFEKFGVLRGASWKSFKEKSALSGFRYAVPPGTSDVTYGFRVVLAPAAVSSRPPASIDEETDPE